MKTTVSLSDFRNAFVAYNRKDNFSWDGLEALFNWIKEFDESCSTETELDVIGLCCEFTEYEDIAEFQEAYGVEYKTIDDIAEQTTVISIENRDGFIIQTF